MKRAVMAAVAALGLGAANARADVILTFTQTSPTSIAGSRATFEFSGSITLTDAAFAGGLSLSYRNTDPVSVFPQPPAEILDLALTTNYTGGNAPPRTDTPANFFARRPVNSLSNFREIDLASAPGGLPTGRIRFGDFEKEYEITISGATATGRFAADYASVDCAPIGTRGCAFTLAVTATPTPVPEPATLALFGLGLLGLAAVHRRRA